MDGLLRALGVDMPLTDADSPETGGPLFSSSCFAVMPTYLLARLPAVTVGVLTLLDVLFPSVVRPGVLTDTVRVARPGVVVAGRIRFSAGVMRPEMDAREWWDATLTGRE
jgi:hypothetical protein